MTTGAEKNCANPISNVGDRAVPKTSDGLLYPVIGEGDEYDTPAPREGLPEDN